MWQSKRSYSPEILDKGPSHYTLQEYNQCLRFLSRINRYLGGFRASKKAFASLDSLPRSILEVGCGGGYFCKALHKWMPKARIVGTDINPMAIEHAQTECFPGSPTGISYELQTTPKLSYKDNSFDVVTTMLVCHHMTDEELVEFLKASYRVCTQAIIVNDLHRHILAYMSFSFIAPLLFPNRLIWNDGRLSVRRSFRKNDWIELLEHAGFKKEQYTISWNWAFRWTVTIRKL